MKKGILKIMVFSLLPSLSFSLFWKLDIKQVSRTGAPNGSFRGISVRKA